MQCYVLINKTAPVGSTEDPETRYDDEGNKIAYNELMYKDDLEKPKYAKNPYIFLFKDYEKKWKHYEVFVMLFKLAFNFLHERLVLCARDLVAVAKLARDRLRVVALVHI